MAIELDMTFKGQQRINELKKKKGPPKGVKYKHDSAIGMHLSRRTGMCLCLDTCCQDEGGCKCKACRCRAGEYNHGDVIPDARPQQREEESEARPESEEMREVCRKAYEDQERTAGRYTKPRHL